MLTAEQLQRRGREAINRGRFAAARRWSSLALERQPDVDTRVEALLQLAIVAAETEGLTRGRELCDEASSIVGTSDVVRGHVQARRGLLAMRAGDMSAALVAFQEAQPKLATDRAALAGMLLNRGSLHLQLHHLEAAIADFREVIVMVGDDDPVEAAKALHNWGYAEFLAGNPIPALRMMEQAGEVLRPISPVWAATSDSDRAEVLAACGLHQEAASALERAARSFGIRRFRQPQAEAELARARIMIVDQPRDAAIVARRAARRFRAWGSHDWALRADAVEFAGDSAASRITHPQLTQARELHGVLVEHRLRHDAQQLALYAARAAVAIDPAQSIDWLSLAKVGAAAPLSHRLLAREIRARHAAARGRRAAALDHLRRGVDGLHEWLSDFGSHDLQSSAVGHGRDLTRLGVRLAIADGRPEVVFEWAERARVLTSRVTPVKGVVDTTADLTELRSQSPENPGPVSVRKATASPRDSGQLQARIRQHAWYTPSSGAAARPASLAEVRATLTPRDVLVSFLVADNQVYALVVDDAEPELVALGPLEVITGTVPSISADLEMAAGALPDSLRAVVGRSLDSALDRLGEILLGPVAARLAGRRVVIVPAARLGPMPWTLLPSLRGQPVTVARSATHWRSLQTAPFELERVGFVRGPRLPHAAEEIERASLAWTGAEVDLQATADRTAALAENVDVLHIAAHGRHLGDSPMFSGVELFDGPWFGYDIDQLAHLPAVVVLSACEVGASTVRAQEYLIGMTTAWLHAGAQCVIASPVAVNDRTAAEMFPFLHASLAGGAAPAVALADAAAAVDHPGPFICFGRGW